MSLLTTPPHYTHGPYFPHSFFFGRWHDVLVWPRIYNLGIFLAPSRQISYIVWTQLRAVAAFGPTSLSLSLYRASGCPNLRVSKRCLWETYKWLFFSSLGLWQGNNCLLRVIIVLWVIMVVFLDERSSSSRNII